MDTLLNTADQALRTLFAPHHSRRPLPPSNQQSVKPTSRPVAKTPVAQPPAFSSPGPQAQLESSRFQEDIDPASCLASSTESGVRLNEEPKTLGFAPELTATERKLSGALMRVNHVGEVCAQALYIAQAQACQTPALKAQFLAAAQDEVDHLAWTEQRLAELGARPSWLNPLWFAGAYGLGLLAGRMGDRVSLGFVAETEMQVAEHLQGHLRELPENDTESRHLVQHMKADELAHARQAMQAGGVDLPAPAKWLMRTAAKFMTTVAHRI